MNGRTVRVFDAWALPEGIALPDRPPSTRQAEGLSVRVLDVDPVWVGTAARTLRTTGRSLRDLSTRDIAAVLGRVAERFLSDDDPLRQEALELLPATSGLSAQMGSAVLDGMACDWTRERLIASLEADFPDPAVLDGFVDGARGQVRALGPRLCVQVVSGSVPGVGATALIRSLLVKAPTLLKPGWGDVVLPVLIARAIAEVEPTLAAATAVVYWPGGSDALEDAALAEADTVVVYGGDEAAGALRTRTPVTTRVVAYHHRVSLGVVGRDALAPDVVHRTASEVAGSVAFFDQRGCVSPQTVYVERGGAAEPAGFAREVAAAMVALERSLPAGTLDPREAAALQQARSTAEVLSASGSGAQLHHGGQATWTVIFDPDDVLAPACVGRVVRIVPVDDVLDVPERVAPRGEHLQTVGTAGLTLPRLQEVAEAFAEVGASRISPFGDVPFPPPWWHHDGQGPLRALVRWVDVEA